jgi:hypothetical protein
MRSLPAASLSLTVLVTLLGACASASNDPSVPLDPAATDVEAQGNGAQGPHGAPEPGEAPMLGVHGARDAASRPSAKPGNMTSHGGAIMNDSVVTAIFWGSSWSNPAFAGDKIDGLGRLYAGLGSATAYVASNTEYTGTNGNVGTSVSYTGSLVDTSAAPTRAPKTSAILAEVCKMISNPQANGYYPVYVDTKRGGAGYCAWHSYGSCGGVPVQFGFFFNLDGDAGCDPKDTETSHSQGLAALASVTGHEWSETVTDPRNGGWWDSAGNENADKCAWSFPSSLTTTTDPTTNAVEGWKIQGNWSNAAFTAKTGYMNRDGQLGCLPN